MALGKPSFLVVLKAGILGVFISTADAGLTTVAPPPTGEATHLSILDHVYGSGFMDMGGGVLSNGAHTASRIDDFAAGGGTGLPLNLVFGTPGLPVTDQIWTDGIAQASAVAKYAAYSQEFGFDNGSGYQKLFDVNVTGPSGFDIAGASAATFSPGSLWQWARSGTGGTFYSNEASNVDQLDHLVSYQITGASIKPNETVWLLMWEDLPGPLSGMRGSDRDFNDLVVEVHARIIPVPGSVLLGAVGLAFVATVRRKFSAKP